MNWGFQNMKMRMVDFSFLGHLQTDRQKGHIVGIELKLSKLLVQWNGATSFIASLPTLSPLYHTLNQASITSLSKVTWEILV